MDFDFRKLSPPRLLREFDRQSADLRALHRGDNQVLAAGLIGFAREL